MMSDRQFRWFKAGLLLFMGLAWLHAANQVQKSQHELRANYYKGALDAGASCLDVPDRFIPDDVECFEQGARFNRSDRFNMSFSDMSERQP